MSPFFFSNRYKHFTLLAQSVGSMVVGVEALFRLTPDVFVETVGFAFIAPIAKVLGCCVISYVHYPTIRFSFWIVFLSFDIDLKRHFGVSCK